MESVAKEIGRSFRLAFSDWSHTLRFVIVIFALVGAAILFKHGFMAQPAASQPADDPNRPSVCDPTPGPGS